MGNIFGNSHKTALLKAHECFSHYDNFIFDLKTSNGAISNEQKQMVLFSLTELQKAFTFNIQVVSQHDWEKQQKIIRELENIKNSVGKYNLGWSQQRTLDYASTLSSSNVIADICNLLENLLDNSQSSWNSRRPSTSSASACGSSKN